MTRFGYHASHEQFAPSELLSLIVMAEAAGFTCAKSSDHFHPWSERQGQSGFAWSWLGAAMQVTSLPFGIITAPGYRYHPAVIAQSAATLAEMFPDRLWLALGSGEAINEAITGEAWPPKPERNTRLLECASIIRNLFAGETVTHHGSVHVVEAKLYSRPGRPVPIYGAAVTPETAALHGSWADGLLTVGGEPANVRHVIEAFYDGGGEGKPVIIQMAVSWASTYAEAVQHALDQWGPVSLGGDLNWDLRRPQDFDHASRLIRKEDVAKAVFISDHADAHVDYLSTLAGLGATEIHIHNVGKNQRAFIEHYGHNVLPHLQKT